MAILLVDSFLLAGLWLLWQINSLACTHLAAGLLIMTICDTSSVQKYLPKSLRWIMIALACISWATAAWSFV